MTFLKRLLAVGIVCSVGIGPICAIGQEKVIDRTIKSFAIIPVADPEYFALQASGFSPVWTRIRNNAIGDGIFQAMKSEGPELGRFLQNEVSSALKVKGMVEVLAPEDTPPGRPKRVIGSDDRKIDADAIVLIYFHGQGVAWRRALSAYLPEIFISYCVVTKQSDGKCVLENTAQYGGDATRDSALLFKSAENEKWPDIEALVNSVPGLIDAFKSGSKKIAVGVSNEIVSYSERNLAGSRQNIVKADGQAAAASKSAVDAPASANSISPVVTPNNSVSGAQNSSNAQVVDASKNGKDASDLPEKLRTLDKLHKEGLITQQEYEIKKKEILQRL